MKPAIYAYEFGDQAEMLDVTDSLMLAVAAAEALHGRAKVNLEADFELTETARTCRIDASTDVGRDVAKIFTEFLTLELGKDGFTVAQKVGDAPTAEREASR